MGYFTTEIRPNFDDIDRRVGLGDNSIGVTTTYTEVDKVEYYPSIETFKKKVTRDLFHTTVQRAGYKSIEVASSVSAVAALAFNATEIGNHLWLFVLLVGTAFLSGNIGSSLQKSKEKLGSHRHALWNPHDGRYMQFMRSDLRGFLATYRKPPTK